MTGDRMHRPPLPPVLQRASDDVVLTIEWEDGSMTQHWYRRGAADYLTARYTREAKDAGRVSLCITEVTSEHT